MVIEDQVLLKKDWRRFFKMNTEYKNIIIPDYLIVIRALSIGGKCMSDLHKELNITYVHLHNIKHAFLKMGWVHVEAERRRHNLFLTEKGKRILSISNSLLTEMGITNEYIDKKIKESKIKKTPNVDKEQIKKDMGL